MVPRIETVPNPAEEFATGPAGPAWAALSRWLDERGIALREEVRDYPTPIARCDVQLTKLLEHRSAVIAARGRMRDLEAAGGDFPSREAVAAWLARGPATDDPVEARLRENLRASLFSRPCLD
jgi:hypothetical protein